MAHESQLKFVDSVRNIHPTRFNRASVLEYGSLNVNGSVRQFFTSPVKYVGIDARPGPDVDVVCVAHEYDPPTRFDIVISCEMLEHDPYALESIRSMWLATRDDGLIIMTCAGPHRAPHSIEKSPEPGHYQNVSMEMLADWFNKSGHMREMHYSYVREDEDLYFWGIK